MSYSPAIQYRGDQYAFQGITGAASGLEDLIKKQRELETTGSYNDAIIQHARQNGLIDQEQFNKYLGANHQQKTGIAAGIAANIAADWQRKQANDAATLHRDQMAQAMTIAHMAHDPADTSGQTLYHPTTGAPIGTYDERGTPHYYPQSITDTSGETAGPIQVDPFIDPATQKPVPGMGIVRKTGQIGYFGELLNAGGGVKIETDPKTGLKFYRDAKGNPKPLDPTKVIQSQLTAGQPEVPAQPAPAPAGPPVPAPPQIGEVRKGYRFKGGDPGNQASWEKVAGQ